MTRGGKEESAGRAPRVRGEGLYRFLLYAYPPRFRRRYAADMLAFYRERIATVGRGGRGMLAVWGQLIPDLLATAFAEWMAPLHRTVERAPAVISIYSNRREAGMSILMQDIRYALRSMIRRPTFTAVVLATLALGIGANAAIFTVVNAVLLRPLPYAQQDRIAIISNGDPYDNISEPEFVDYQREVTAFTKLAAFNGNTVTITVGNGEPTRTTATRVSRDFFAILGVQPQLGRVFSIDEFSPQSHVRGVVISHRLWVQQFAGDVNVVGKTLTLNAVPCTIVGVMPARFAFPDAETTVWTAWRMNPDSLWTRNNHYLGAVGLLGPGKSIDLARTQALTLNAHWMTDYPDMYDVKHPIKSVVIPLRERLLGATQPYLLALLGAVCFILLIACVNVANLLLVRGEARRKEFAIRTALGASRSRVVRQTLTESMLFAVFGAAIGLVLAWLGVRALVELAPSDLPRLEQVSVDYRVVVFTTLITVLTGLVFGLAPALRGVRGRSAEDLRSGGKTSAVSGSRAARRALVVAEVALAVVILTGAGLLIRSLIKLQASHIGFDVDQLSTMQVTLPPKKYSDTTADEYFRQLLDRVRHLPGVRDASAVYALPITGDDSFWSIIIDGRVLKTIAEAPGAKPQVVMPGFFQVMGVPITRGRAFDEHDRMGAPAVVIVSDGLAKQLWPGVDPIGHTLRMFGEKAMWATVVGVAADVSWNGFQRKAAGTMYFPYSQSGSSAYVMPRSMTILTKTAGAPDAIVPTVRGAIRALDASAAISQVANMERVLGDSIASRRFTTVLLAGFATLALLLAGIGIYGVISYGVSQRTYEIGVRMAMGASAASILRMILREGVDMAVGGLALGIVGALIVDRLLGSMLVDVSANDGLTLGLVTGALAIVAACASALPARRATRVSPTEALRAG